MFFNEIFENFPKLKNMVDRWAKKGYYGLIERKFTKIFVENIEMYGKYYGEKGCKSTEARRRNLNANQQSS